MTGSHEAVAGSRVRVRARLREARLAAVAPITYLCLFGLLMAVWKVFDLPSPERTYDIIVESFRSHGLLLVAVGSLVEGLVLIGLYFPGSAVIVLGVATSVGDPARAALVVLIVTLTFVGAAQVNYAIGRFGFHYLIKRLGGQRMLDRAERRYARYGLAILPPSFIHPNLGGFMSVASGIGAMPWRRFLVTSALSISAWNAAWGVITYFFAEGVKQVATQPWLVVGGLASWASLAALFGFVRPRNSDEPRTSGGSDS